MKSPVSAATLVAVSLALAGLGLGLGCGNSPTTTTATATSGGTGGHASSAGSGGASATGGAPGTGGAGAGAACFDCGDTEDTCTVGMCVNNACATQPAPAGTVCHPEQGVCNGKGGCVQCLQDSDCTDPTLPACDTTTNMCEGAL